MTIESDSAIKQGGDYLTPEEFNVVMSRGPYLSRLACCQQLLDALGESPHPSQAQIKALNGRY